VTDAVWGGFLLVACACAPERTPASADVGEHPTRVRLAETSVIPLLEDDQPLVSARIAGVGEATLLIDTGAEFSWIDTAYAEREELEREPLGATLVGIYAETVIAERTHIDRLEVGGLVVTDLRPPLIAGLRDDVDGGIGQDLLRMVEVVIDGPGRRLILIPRGEWDAAMRTLIQPGNVALAYDVDRSSGVPVIHVPVADLEGQRAFAIDTGAGAMTVTAELARELQLEQLGSETGFGLTHANPVVPTYAVRDLTLQDLIVSDDALEAPQSRLGWGVLRTLVVVFENAGDRMLIFPDPSWAR
jgi:hypothetical protein